MRRALALALMLAGCSDYVLVPAGRPIAVARSGLTVTPDRAWNRNAGLRPGKRAESWTLDGPLLNDLTFYGGIEDGEPLFREVDKREAPLPRFAATMLASDIAELVERSYRVATGTTLFEMNALAPARLAGREGFVMRYRYTLPGDEVRRRGEARGAVVAGRLYLLTYEAPAILYFERDLAAFRAVADGARLTLDRTNSVRPE
ncbi:hypothetical protein [Sphingomonas sp. Y38-1Y]|uniref:hypothetical protein n=1 Tax=Sphingomonas sp. Y38-1Y TaxID=3078265 RepID=UPI0028EEF645|nr:hypothetical protein [Sphingomonas sp. Y38-1Y]